MWAFLRGVLIVVLAVSTGAGAAFATYAWPLWFNPDYMLTWALAGVFPAAIVGLAALVFSFKLFAHLSGLREDSSSLSPDAPGDES